MRQIRMKVAAFLGGPAVLQPGDVVDVDDRRAAQLVELGHAEFVVRVATPAPQAVVRPQPTRAVDPKPAAERAIARK